MRNVRARTPYYLLRRKRGSEVGDCFVSRQYQRKNIKRDEVRLGGSRIKRYCS